MAATSPFAAFATITPFQYLNMTIVDARVKGIYSNLLAGKYAKARSSIVDMYVNLMRAEELDFDKPVYNAIYAAFAHMKIDAALGKYDDVHNRLRDLHYILAQAQMAEEEAAEKAFQAQQQVYDYEVIPWMNDDDELYAMDSY